jgi:hypothetical protein
VIRTAKRKRATPRTTPSITPSTKKRKASGAATKYYKQQKANGTAKAAYAKRKANGTAKRCAELEEQVSEIRKSSKNHANTDVYLHKVNGLIVEDTHSLEFAAELMPAEMEYISSAAVKKIQDFANKQDPGAMLYIFNAGEHRTKTESMQTVTIRIKDNKPPMLAAHSNSVKAFKYDHEVVYMQNSIVNVDAVEKICIKAAQNDQAQCQAHQCLCRSWLLPWVELQDCTECLQLQDFGRVLGL